MCKVCFTHVHFVRVHFSIPNIHGNKSCDLLLTFTLNLCWGKKKQNTKKGNENKTCWGKDIQTIKFSKERKSK
jgi:hypothetical protein